MKRQVCRAAGGGDLFALLVQVLQKPSHDLKQQLAVYSKRVAGCVTELIQAAEAMKGWFAACSAPPRGTYLRSWTSRHVASACFS